MWEHKYSACKFNFSSCERFLPAPKAAATSTSSFPTMACTFTRSGLIRTSIAPCETGCAGTAGMRANAQRPQMISRAATGCFLTVNMESSVGWVDLSRLQEEFLSFVGFAVRQIDQRGVHKYLRVLNVR